MEHVLSLSEKLTIKGRTVTVTEAAFTHLLPVRAFLIAIARTRTTITYGELCDLLDLPYSPRGLGRFLDLIAADSRRRQEPSLAALVVAGETGEVGADFDGEPASERQSLYRFWGSRDG